VALVACGMERKSSVDAPRNLSRILLVASKRSRRDQAPDGPRAPGSPSWASSSRSRFASRRWGPPQGGRQTSRKLALLPQFLPRAYRGPLYAATESRMIPSIAGLAQLVECQLPKCPTTGARRCSGMKTTRILDPSTARRVHLGALTVQNLKTAVRAAVC
jgi:hypothetical protein